MYAGSPAPCFTLQIDEFYWLARLGNTDTTQSRCSVLGTKVRVDKAKAGIFKFVSTHLAMILFCWKTSIS